jgi:hypothetical protein
MAKKDETEEIVDIDIDEWKAQLSLPEDTEGALLEIGTRFEKLNAAFGELLLYMNAIDERDQKLAGEPVVTSIALSHVGADGIANLDRMRPEIPEGIRDPIDTKAKHGSRTETPKMKRANEKKKKALPPVVSK